MANIAGQGQLARSNWLLWPTPQAALASLHRCYPQIYSSEVKLAVDPYKVTPVFRDFVEAMNRVVPSAKRMEADTGLCPQPLVPALRALLGGPVAEAMGALSSFYRRFKAAAAGSETHRGDAEWYDVPPQAEATARQMCASI